MYLLVNLALEARFACRSPLTRRKAIGTSVSFGYFDTGLLRPRLFTTCCLGLQPRKLKLIISIKTTTAARLTMKFFCAVALCAQPPNHLLAERPRIYPEWASGNGYLTSPLTQTDGWMRAKPSQWRSGGADDHWRRFTSVFCDRLDVKQFSDEISLKVRQNSLDDQTRQLRAYQT